MGWFRRSKTPAKRATSGDPVVQSLVLVLSELRDHAPSKHAADFAKVIGRLERPPAPSGLVREVARLMEMRGAKGATTKGQGGGGTDATELVESLIRTMRRLALLDPSLDRRIATLSESVPKKIGRVDVHRLLKRSKELDGFAQPVRHRALEDRKQNAQVLKEVSAALAKAGSAGSALHERVGRLVDALVEQPNADRAAEARQTLLAQVREVSAGLDQLRGDLHKANEKSKGLEDLLATQAAEMLDLGAKSALDPLTELCHRVTFDSALAYAVRRAHAADQALGLAIFEIDGHREIADRQGETAAEDLLVEIARYLRSHVREEDVLGRVESAQFAVILADLEDEVVVSIAERLRVGLSRIQLQDDKERPIQSTSTAGVAMLQAQDKPKQLMFRASGALDEARDAGRDRLVLAS